MLNLTLAIRRSKKSGIYVIGALLIIACISYMPWVLWAKIMAGLIAVLWDICGPFAVMQLLEIQPKNNGKR